MHDSAGPGGLRLRSCLVGEAPAFDLQCHSTCSDGTLEPAAVVARAAEAGVELLALSDHDTVAGLEEAEKEARRRCVQLVPAAELSAVHEQSEDLHILGYAIDRGDSALLAALEDARADRGVRAEAMASALRECGFAVKLPRVEDRPIGRPHIAAAAFADRANAARLADEGISSASELLAAYLVPGRPAYRPRTHPTVGDAIALIHAAGGVAVWAHPFWDMASAAEVIATIERFVPLGLDGVEVFYPTHSREQVEVLVRESRARGLLMTGSSDFHGPEHPHFASFRAFSLYGFEPELGRLAAGAARG
jgi:predicted metal-dependent phosphoesterase TrpH